MGHPQKLCLVISGYYGFRNSGDEAVLTSILAALNRAEEKSNRKITPIILSGDPQWTSQHYKVQAVDRKNLTVVWRTLKKSDGLISGGGSLLQDVTGIGSIPYYLGIMECAIWCKKPIFIYAQGIGPVQRQIFKPLIARAFKRASYISVRDVRSKELLLQYGVSSSKIDVVPDPVLGLPQGFSLQSAAQLKDDPLERMKTFVIGVSVRFWRNDRQDLDRIAETMGELAKKVPVQIRFLPFHQGLDEQASQYVMDRLIRTGTCKVEQLERIPAYDNPQQMLAQISRCSLVLGMRLHSLIYAANQNIPFQGISYDPKIDQFLKQLGQTPIGSTECLLPSAAATQLADMLHHNALWHKNCDERIAHLKQMAQRPAEQIVSFFEKGNGE